MHFPVQIGVGNFSISAHLLCETLAMVVGFRYFLYLRKRQPDAISDSNRVWILIGAAFGAFFFSRLLGSLEHPELFVNSPNKLLYFYANKTIIGGLLGGLLTVELVKKRLQVTHSSGDLFTFPLIVAMIIGRIGCFTTGVYEETYGEPTTSIFGMDLGDGILRHPVTLYEIAFLLLLAGFLKYLERTHTLRDGYRFQLFMALYLLFRLLLDFIKPGYTVFWEIGTIQVCCILGLLYYRHILWKLFIHPTVLYERQ